MFFNTAAKPKSVQESIEESFGLEGPPDVHVTIGGKTYLYFAGSGYLGLQSSPEILAAACEAVLQYGVGTAAMRTALTSPPVFEVERRIAAMLGTERSLYTVSGYSANQILITALEGTFDRIFIDESAHYSLFDAAKRMKRNRKLVVFRHCSTSDLKDKLDSELLFNERPMILTDGVFSMLGTAAPLREYIDLLSHYEGASLCIDDAQGFGVLGANGLGTLEHFGISPALANRTIQDNSEFDLCGEFAESIPEVKLYLGFSLSKAAGGGGGIIAGSETFIQYLKDRSTFYHAASAPANPIAAATAKALPLVAAKHLRQNLHENVRTLKNKLRNIGIQTNDTPIPMAVFTLGSSLNMRRIQKELSQRGILISYLPRYAGLGSEGALRIAVFATHTEEMISELMDTLKSVI
ncbi:MAG: aminotransferase class I/II-fold pyridoxal phosphate-dependent enzyme [Planctomycetaceae bacterium]|nr:aminotransferase class I/II-fold pyridoxal phosphate-dependent enzyme [Planctomycetaceae bacterium]